MTVPYRFGTNSNKGIYQHLDSSKYSSLVRSKNMINGAILCGPRTQFLQGVSPSIARRARGDTTAGATGHREPDHTHTRPRGRNGKTLRYPSKVRATPRKYQSLRWYSRNRSVNSGIDARKMPKVSADKTGLSRATPSEPHETEISVFGEARQTSQPY